MLSNSLTQDLVFAANILDVILTKNTVYSDAKHVKVNGFYKELKP